MEEKKMNEEFERKNKEIKKGFNLIIQKISSFTEEKLKKFMVNIQPQIKKLDEMNRRLKKEIKEKENERKSLS